MKVFSLPRLYTKEYMDRYVKEQIEAFKNSLQPCAFSWRGPKPSQYYDAEGELRIDFFPPTNQKVSGVYTRLPRSLTDKEKLKFGIK